MATMGKPFWLGVVRCSSSVLKSVEATEVLLALQRHRAMDWSGTPPDVVDANMEGLERGSEVESCHVSKDGTRYWVITDGPRQRTIVVTQWERNLGRGWSAP